MPARDGMGGHVDEDDEKRAKKHQIIPPFPTSFSKYNGGSPMQHQPTRNNGKELYSNVPPNPSSSPVFALFHLTYISAQG